MDNIDKFYEILFEPTEQVCWANDIYGTRVFYRDTMRHQMHANFFSINPLLTGRLDANVTCFRNILIEFDSLDLIDQLDVLQTVPKSTVVYSGGKSYHAIISLAEPCETRAEYDKLVRRILKKLPDADASTKNPSRLSRAPGAIRDGVEQKLKYVGERIPRQVLEDWLGPEPLSNRSVQVRAANTLPRILRGSTVYFLNFGAPDGRWNRDLFLATLDLARAQYGEDELYSKLEAVTGHLDKKDLSTIKSALKAAKDTE